MGFSRQKYWNGRPCPLPGDFPDPGIEPVSLTSLALAGGFFTTSTAWEVPQVVRPVSALCSVTHVPLYVNLCPLRGLFSPGSGAF